MLDHCVSTRRGDTLCARPVTLCFFCPSCSFSRVLHAAATVKSEFFTTSDGVKLHYLESGAGPTILFVPGWTMPANIWQPQIEYFSRNYHVVAIDPRSQGDSDKTPDGNYPGRRAQDYKELIDHLGGSPVVMVGWSLAVQ